MDGVTAADAMWEAGAGAWAQEKGRGEGGAARRRTAKVAAYDRVREAAEELDMEEVGPMVEERMGMNGWRGREFCV